MKLYLLAALVAAAGVVAMVAVSRAQQHVIPDTVVRDNGRTVGTISRDSSGMQIFRNSAGAVTGTATTDSSGTTTFRDASGTVSATTSRR
jgi:hypothetical protein